MATTDDIPDEGLTLRQAIERYSDPEVLQAYLAARRNLPQCPPVVHSPYLASRRDEELDCYFGRKPINRTEISVDAYKRAASNCARLWQAIDAGFKEKFKRGELIATAFEYPMTPTSDRIVVRDHLWDRLNINFDKNVLRGPGFTLFDVRIRPAVAENEADETISAPVPELTPPTARPVGRPSAKNEVIAELTRRIASGHQQATCAAEARHLQTWINNKHDREVYKNPTSLENVIRKIYEKPKAQKTT